MPTETPIIFTCEGSRLLGLLSNTKSETGLLLIVGGPQYRVGSHRQFVSLTRAVANAGFSTFRFDYRGMGDSEGELLGFEHIGKDIDAALQIFLDTCPDLKQVVIWGLCDAASAAMMYVGENSRQPGLIVLNPWLRTDKTQAQTFIRHYYLSRLLSGSFWHKLFSGNFKFYDSLKSGAANVFAAFGDQSSKITAKNVTDRIPTDVLPYPQRMQNAMAQYPGQILMIFSGDDLTAAEFLDTTTRDKSWAKILGQANFQRKTIPQANHTFADLQDKKQVENWTIDWLRKL